MDCTKFSDGNCAEQIGGTSVVWGTGESATDPKPDAWHYCGGYDGPKNAQEPVLWPRAPKLDHRTTKEAKARKTLPADLDLMLPARLRNKEKSGVQIGHWADVKKPTKESMLF